MMHRAAVCAASRPALTGLESCVRVISSASKVVSPQIVNPTLALVAPAGIVTVPFTAAKSNPGHDCPGAAVPATVAPSTRADRTVEARTEIGLMLDPDSVRGRETVRVPRLPSRIAALP